MKPRKKFFTDERLEYLIRWWSVGAVYFFVGWGTGLGNQVGTVDFIFFLGLGIGVFNIAVINPLIRKMLNVRSNKRYNETTVFNKVLTRLKEIFKSMLIVLIMVYVYSLINQLLIKVLSLSPSQVPFPGEPITFGIIYVIILMCINKIMSMFRRHCV
ncbi:hypothetical protein SH1V18_19010 [Vallitalea longa]|uniref:Uncharacterized protein n=1 Tax=Vallitalea longa TaxID=2936439 RepID=A0A9W5YB41_9FIRM|nr:hypothetical protein [Vallitalea longa]GKX29421.1 hypothetical protein SH1V18_19010 [Vallitalea longa]